MPRRRKLPEVLTRDYLIKTVGAKARTAVAQMRDVPMVITPSTNYQVVITLNYSNQSESEYADWGRTQEELRSDNIRLGIEVRRLKSLLAGEDE